MGFFERVERAPKRQARKSVFTIVEIQTLLSPWCLKKILARVPFNAAKAFEELPTFQERGIKRANAIGDALGDRGFAFYRKEPNFKFCDASLGQREVGLEVAF